MRPGASIFEISNVTARRLVGNPFFIANQAGKHIRVALAPGPTGGSGRWRPGEASR